MNVVELENVAVRLNGIQVLEAIELAVPAGDFVALIGPNGAGKTTLLRVVLGRIRPDAGRVRLFSQDVDEFRSWGRVAYIPQHAANFDAMFPASVWEVAALGRVPRRGLLRFLSPEDRRAVGEALERVGMTDKRRRRIGDLSGGEKQRVLIARALAAQPDLLILDEPTTGVDPGTQEHFYDFLRRLNAERGLTILMATHDLGAVMRVVKTIACINRRLICHAPASEGLSAERLLETYGSSLAVLAHVH